MFVAIFAYIDRIFSVVRPRRTLFMAIDGPAPRAKMNQQRSRRFKAAKERADKEAETSALRAEILAAGKTPPPEGGGTKFDSNVITPGTQVSPDPGPGPNPHFHPEPDPNPNPNPNSSWTSSPSGCGTTCN